MFLRLKGVKMRRKDRLIAKTETLDILQKGEYGVLSTVSNQNEPYGVPVNYCCQDNFIYFHCALEGKKIDNLNNNAAVSFCVVGKTEIRSDKFTTKFESCIINGLASEAIDAEKQRALVKLVEKYSPNFISEGMDYIKHLNDKVKVFKISLDCISGKASR